MQIKNSTNNSSFGMAFKTPEPHQMERFTRYITKDRNVKQVQRGLKQLKEKQAFNKHFDIEYVCDNNQNNFLVTPFSNKAEKLYASEVIYPKDNYQTYLESVVNKLTKESKALQNEDAGIIRKMLFKIKAGFKILNAEVYTYFNPIENLPKNLLAANELATVRANCVQEQIKNEKLISDVFKKN